MYVDSHCHLSFPELAARVDDVRLAMAEARVGRALCMCTSLEEFPAVHALATRYDNFWASAGVHPDSEGVREPGVADLAALAELPRVVAIGEAGLDYYRLNGRSVDEMAWQRERFRVHIRAALAAALPLVIHTRNASSDTLAILREEGAAAAGGVFHCFTETEAVARAALDLGFYISFSGILTFRNASELRDVARFVPLERCLIETDSPYLAPMPHRGRTNNPSYVPLVAQQLADLKQCAVQTIAEATSTNFERLFRRVTEPHAGANTHDKMV
jgi:TatD DNase family protein